MLADATTAFALFVGLSILRFGTDAWERIWASAGIDARLAAFLYSLALVAVLWVQGLYRLRVRWSRRREALDVTFAVLLLAVVVFTALFLFKLPNVSRLFLILLFPSQALLTIASRTLIRLTFLRLRASGYNLRFMLVVGANPTGASVRRRPGSSLGPWPRADRYLAGPEDRASGDDAAGPTTGPRRPGRHRGRSCTPRWSTRSPSACRSPTARWSNQSPDCAKTRAASFVSRCWGGGHARAAAGPRRSRGCGSSPSSTDPIGRSG